MESLAAFSLACGVIQIVDFSTKALTKCKEIYDHGALSEYHDVEEISNRLTDLQKDLRISSPRDNEIPSDKGLLDLATKCSATATQLVTKLRDLRINGPRRKRDAFKKTVKYIRERKDIQDIQKRLDSYRNALDTHILINLRQRHDMASLQQTQGFQYLDQQVRNLIISLSQGFKGFEELKIVVRRENEQTRDHFDKVFQQKEAQEKKENYRKQFLNSLWFTEIHSREERIADAHRETFEWIFDNSGQAVRPWDNYVQWLESGRDAYWINGKAGSGKSTLMSFLCQDDRTKEPLRAWSGGKESLMPKFFFWSGGTAMEKSIDGLLRSLIWQILEDLPDLDIGFPQTTAAWTERRLRTTLQKTVQLALNTHSLCFFIDGLDEFGGEQAELISFVQEAMQGTNVKVCLSSRPYRTFEKAFGSSAKLRLQDLTHTDIQRFVVDNIQGMEQASAIALQHPRWLEDVTKEILERAEGVFLWVFLVVRDQMHGLRNGDSPAQLRERLGSLPDEIEGVYAHMLSQIEKCYRRQASQLLQIALHGADHGSERSLLGAALALQGRLDDRLGSSDSIPELELIETSHSIRARIGTTCAGLLEIHDDTNSEEDDDDTSAEADDYDAKSEEDDDDDANAEKDVDVKAEEDGPSYGFRRYDLTLGAGGEITKDQILNLESRVTVDFVHRTAIDFLRDPRQGGEFLKAHNPSHFDPHVSQVKVSLGKMRLFGIQRRDYIDKIMNWMSQAESRTGVAQEQLCELIDDVMSTIDHAHPDWRPDSHWCTRWGDLSLKLMINFAKPEMSSQLSSQSSSMGSFYFMGSQIWTRPNHVNIWVKEVDFLTFAARHGLYRYVKQVLDFQKVPIGKGAANWLLICSEYSFGQEIRRSKEGVMAGVILMGECLGQGADPNTERLRYLKPENKTVWSGFLEDLHKYLHCDQFGRVRLIAADFAELQKIFLQTTLAFIENGADLHGLVIVDVVVTTLPDAYCRFYVELSPLALFALCFHDPNEISQIKDICVAKGARSYYGILLKPLTGDGQYDEGLGELELSEQESAAFIKLFKKDLTTRAARTHFEHQCSRLGDEIYQDRKKRLG